MFCWRRVGNTTNEGLPGKGSGECSELRTRNRVHSVSDCLLHDRCYLRRLV
jgi:hypothetical protein